ncbi:N-acetylmuramoyl-L-alanine amidase family protein [Shimia aestuarii]|uniref:N-acetylmuramoyl-L-alanine amidase family protein n=1 Tax=Shimia aestuarii TaxID=254406 RepID=UPI001FB330D9|nr:N-acetylmuramoyl-L-alanine amidase [Shimia aestuarii]
MKLAIVVGHNARAQGAVRPDTGVTEWSWNKGLAEIMRKEARRFGLDAEVFFREAGHGGYLDEIEAVYGATDAWGADVTVELHFNSHDNPAATGTETLSSGSPASLRIARAVQEEMVEALGLKDRGVKTRRSGRGYASLISGRAPAILIEPFFGSSAKGQAASDEASEKRALALAVLRGIERAT